VASLVASTYFLERKCFGSTKQRTSRMYTHLPSTVESDWSLLQQAKLHVEISHRHLICRPKTRQPQLGRFRADYEHKPERPSTHINAEAPKTHAPAHAARIGLNKLEIPQKSPLQNCRSGFAPRPILSIRLKLINSVHHGIIAHFVFRVVHTLFYTFDILYRTCEGVVESKG
jgi:hypothetical protein